MGRRPIERKGDKFNAWTLVSDPYRNAYEEGRKVYWMADVVCECGRAKTTRLYEIAIGRSRACASCAPRAAWRARKQIKCGECGGPSCGPLCRKCAPHKIARRVTRCKCGAAIFFGGDASHECPPTSATAYMYAGGRPPVWHAAKAY